MNPGCSADITVIIPAYNAAATLRKCLEALAAQTVRPRETIVVDDGSTDATSAQCAGLARVVVNQGAKGPGGARNFGACHAGGAILAFTDSDCLPPPFWLEKIEQALNDPTVGAVGGGYSNGSDDSFWQSFCCLELAYRRRHFARWANTLVSNNFACRAELFRELGGFPEQYPVCEDMLLSYRIGQRSRLVWLSENGVGHHFKTSWAAFLRHQYFFGRESTRFFARHRALLRAGNHQGRALHLAIGLAVALFGALAAGGTAYLAGSGWTRPLLTLALGCAGGHLLLYLGFLRYLGRESLCSPIKAYLVSLSRDLVAGVSIFGGLWQAWREKPLPHTTPIL